MDPKIEAAPMDYGIPDVNLENVQFDFGPSDHAIFLFVASLLIAACLGLLVIDHVSRKRGAFVSILAGAATWVLGTPALLFGAACWLELLTGRSWY